MVHRLRLGTLGFRAVAGCALALTSASIVQAQPADIVDTAVGAGSFKTLVAAVKAAGLVETLKGDGPLTVFAPTDAAFTKLPRGTVASLLKPANKHKLVAILTYHVVPGKVMASDVTKLKDGTSVKTVGGASVKVHNKHGVRINTANVVKADIECSNGVIHVIDTVLLPNSAQTQTPGPERRDAASVRYTKVETQNYAIEVPEGWTVGEETPFGQREMKPADGTPGSASSMSSMTGPGLGKRSWDDLYKTSLYFITRYAPDGAKMEATPYKLGRSKQGFETCSWTMSDAAGRAIQRHVILKHPEGDILALSVKLPSDAATATTSDLEAIFRHMVDTAVVR